MSFITPQTKQLRLLFCFFNTFFFLARGPRPPCPLFYMPNIETPNTEARPRKASCTATMTFARS